MVGILDLYKGGLNTVARTGSFFFEHGKELFDGWVLGPYNENKYTQFNFLHAVPYVKDYMDYLLDKRTTEEYFNRYGMDYSDIHDPRKVPSSASQTRLFGDALNFVSDNVKRLYR